MLIFTDGLENASQRNDRSKVFDLLHQRQDADWTFVFMGANQDSYAAGGGVGFGDGNIQDFAATSASVRDSFSEFGRSTVAYRAKPSHRRTTDRHVFYEGQKLAEQALREQDQH